MALRRQGVEAGELRGDVGDEGPDAVDDGPGRPNAFEPVPRLIRLVLVAGQLHADDGNGGHQPGQGGADSGDVVIHVYDDVLGHRPHIVSGGIGRGHGGKDEKRAQCRRRHDLKIEAG